MGVATTTTSTTTTTTTTLVVGAANHGSPLSPSPTPPSSTRPSLRTHHSHPLHHPELHLLPLCLRKGPPSLQLQQTPRHTPPEVCQAGNGPQQRHRAPPRRSARRLARRPPDHRRDRLRLSGDLRVRLRGCPHQVRHLKRGQRPRRNSTLHRRGKGSPRRRPRAPPSLHRRIPFLQKPLRL